MVPVATGPTTLRWPEASRAKGFYRWTSTSRPAGSGHHGAGVPRGVRVVGERRRVEDDVGVLVDGLVQPADQLGLVVGLPDLDLQVELGAEVPAGVGEVVVRGGAVDLGLACPEPAEVGAVEDQHAAHPPSIGRTRWPNPHQPDPAARIRRFCPPFGRRSAPRTTALIICSTQGRSNITCSQANRSTRHPRATARHTARSPGPTPAGARDARSCPPRRRSAGVHRRGRPALGKHRRGSAPAARSPGSPRGW